MARLYPRAEINLPVNLNVRFENIEAIFNNLSTDGALVRSLSRTSKYKMVGKTAILKYDLSEYGVFEHSAEIIRGKKSTYALKFQNLEHTQRIKLWDYIIENLNDYNKCPYCGEQYDKRPSVCKNCGWKLILNSKGYAKYHEKMCLVKKLYSMVETQSIEQLEKIISFIDINILDKTTHRKLQEFVGASSVMMDVFSKIKKIAPTEFTVLIQGESGTGKELAARAIHALSERRNKPFVKINCASIPENLIESELFGYEKGSFTGAYKSKMGKFESANEGTIFLDEVGAMQFNLQAKLLRVIQESVIEKIGSDKINGKNVNVRIIAATNQDLKVAITKDTFRRDLYYRLTTFILNLPPVMDRGNDKLILANYFLKKFCREMGATKTFAAEAIEAINSYEWPGNVREIMNKVQNSIILSKNDHITPEDLSLEHGKILDAGEIFFGNIITLKEARQIAEKEKLMEALIEFNHNISKVAKYLKISRQTVYSLKKKYSI